MFPTKNLSFEATISKRCIGLSLLYALSVKGPEAFSGTSGVFVKSSPPPFAYCFGAAFDVNWYVTLSRPDFFSGGISDGGVKPSIAAGALGRAREKENSVVSKQVVEKCMIDVQLAQGDMGRSRINYTQDVYQLPMFDFYCLFQHGNDVSIRKVYPAILSNNDNTLCHLNDYLLGGFSIGYGWTSYNYSRRQRR